MAKRKFITTCYFIIYSYEMSHEVWHITVPPYEVRGRLTWPNKFQFIRFSMNEPVSKHQEKNDEQRKNNSGVSLSAEPSIRQIRAVE